MTGDREAPPVHIFADTGGALSDLRDSAEVAGCRIVSASPVGDDIDPSAIVLPGAAVLIALAGEEPAPSALPLLDWAMAEAGAEAPGPRVRVAGRIMLRRDMGRVHFLQVRDWTGQVQVFVGKKQVGEDGWTLAQDLDLGDLLGIDGTLGLTRTGELTVFAESITLLGKSLLPPPEKWHGIEDVETRLRQRYTDLIYSEGVRDRLLLRSAIIDSVRGTLRERRFVGKNVCHTIVYDQAAHDAMSADADSPAQVLFMSGMRAYLEKHPVKKWHDPTAAACHLHPEIGTWFRGRTRRIEAGWGTVADAEGDCILADVDREALWACFRGWH